MTSYPHKAAYRLIAGLCVAACVLAGCAGCGSSSPPQELGVIVKIRIVKGGVPLPAKDNTGIPGMQLVQPYYIALVPVGYNAETPSQGEYVGVYDENGVVTFTGAGQGIPPGVYKLVIVHQLSMPSDATPVDPLEGRFHSDTTPLQVIVTVAHLGKVQDLGTIDLDHLPE